MGDGKRSDTAQVMKKTRLDKKRQRRKNMIAGQLSQIRMKEKLQKMCKFSVNYEDFGEMTYKCINVHIVKQNIGFKENHLIFVVMVEK